MVKITKMVLGIVLFLPFWLVHGINDASSTGQYQLWHKARFHLKEGQACYRECTGRNSYRSKDAGMDHFFMILKMLPEERLSMVESEAFQMEVDATAWVGHAYLKLEAFENSISAYKAVLFLIESQQGHDQAAGAYLWLAHAYAAAGRLDEAHQVAMTAAKIEHTYYGPGPAKARNQWQHIMEKHVVSSTLRQTWNSVLEASAMEQEADDLWDGGDVVAARYLYVQAANKERTDCGTYHNDRQVWLWRKAALTADTGRPWDHRRSLQLQPLECASCTHHYLQLIQKATDYHRREHRQQAIQGYRAAIESFDRLVAIEEVERLGSKYVRLCKGIILLLFLAVVGSQVLSCKSSMKNVSRTYNKCALLLCGSWERFQTWIKEMVATIWLTAVATGKYRHHLTSIYRRNALLLYGYCRKGLYTWAMTAIASVSFITEASGKYCYNFATIYWRSSLFLYGDLAGLQSWIMTVPKIVNMYMKQAASHPMPIRPAWLIKLAAMTKSSFINWRPTASNRGEADKAGAADRCVIVVCDPTEPEPRTLCCNSTCMEEQIIVVVNPCNCSTLATLVPEDDLTASLQSMGHLLASYETDYDSIVEA